MLICPSTKFSLSYYHFSQHTLQLQNSLQVCRGDSCIPWSVAKFSSTSAGLEFHPVSLSFYDLFVPGGGKFVFTFRLMGWVLCMLRNTKSWLGSALSCRCTSPPLCPYKAEQQRLKEHPAASSKIVSVAFRFCSFVILSQSPYFCITQPVFQSTLPPAWPEVN